MHSQQVNERDQFPLLGTCEIASGVRCPVLGFPVQERHGHTGASAVESNQDGQGLEHMM